MEKMKQNCSLEEHNEFDSTNFCPICKIFICNKWEKYHSILFKNHQLFPFDKDVNEIFTGFCKIENHNLELAYFCKDHNELCCAKCFVKIKSKGNDQHINCNVCNIEDIIMRKKIINRKIKYYSRKNKQKQRRSKTRYLKNIY